jgi:hypothetical protein
MRQILLLMFLCNQVLLAAPKQHIITFGKWTTIKSFHTEDSSEPVDLRARPLLVDGRTKGLTFGTVHDVTDEIFVVQRIYRLNDSLPAETGRPRWHWQRGGWILVNRTSGKVQPLLLPEFDSYYSPLAWFRDYAAYCGISEDGKKLFAFVFRIGKRKPLLKKEFGDASENEWATCNAPAWQRSPSRVTFSAAKQPRFTYTVRNGSVGLLPEDEASGDE